MGEWVLECGGGGNGGVSGEWVGAGVGDGVWLGGSHTHRARITSFPTSYEVGYGVGGDEWRYYQWRC